MNHEFVLAALDLYWDLSAAKLGPKRVELVKPMVQIKGALLHG